jgi:hypothetical protein
MGNTLIAFLFGIGVTAWVSKKFYKRTGGNSQKSYGGAIVVGLLAFFLMLIILSYLPA